MVSSEQLENLAAIEQAPVNGIVLGRGQWDKVQWWDVGQ